MNVRDVMTSDPACCTADTRLSDVAKMMLDNDCGEIPVVASRSDGKPIGVVTDRDIVVRMIARGENPLDRTVADCMSEPAITVTEDASLEEALDLMEDNQIRRVPVVGRDGRLVGIIAQADVATQARPRQTAEVLKEVSQRGGKNSH